MAASKLRNFSAPALHNLIRSHLLRPSAAAAAAYLLQSATAANPVPDARLVDPSCMAKPRLPLCFNASFRFSVTQIEAAMRSVSRTDEDAGVESEDSDSVDDSDDDDPFGSQEESDYFDDGNCYSNDEVEDSDETD